MHIAQIYPDFSEHWKVALGSDFMSSKEWLNRIDVVQPFLFGLNWRTRELLEPGVDKVELLF